MKKESLLEDISLFGNYDIYIYICVCIYIYIYIYICRHTDYTFKFLDIDFWQKIP